MVTTESLIQVFFEAALAHKPNMSSHQIHLYVLGLMAHELAYAFNNDFSVAQNVRELLEKLNPSEAQEKERKNTTNSNATSEGKELNQNVIKANSSSSSKIGTNLMPGLTYSKLTNFLSSYPKIVIKDLRDEKNGLLWINGSKMDLEDEKLSTWLLKNKFLWSKDKSTWYFSIV